MGVYKGWNAKIYKDGIEIGKCTEVRVEIDHSLEVYFEAGNQVSPLVIEGPLNIAGRLGHAWVDTTYLSLIQGSGLSGSGSLSSFNLSFKVTRPSLSDMTLYVYGCKLKKGSIGIPQDGFLTEDYDFVARYFAIA